ncbi:hypothetical protein niasHS_003167 [Heterodera schachtii]|uniref:Chromo domain-containing protein n=1 Tax=Heterodera schachtii TaxID=97005 RepID=A0ABD2HYZ6_HETSC
MKHTTRMLLVPEEMYRSLLSKAPSAAASVATGAAAATDALGITPTTTPIEHIAKRMARVARTAQQPAARALMNDDERLIHYQQEYKRFKKLLADEQERPAPVRLNQLPNDPASKGVLRDALTEAAKTLQQPQQQQQTPPSLTKRRRRTAAAAAAVPARAGVHSTPPVSPQPPGAAIAAAPPQQHPERQQNKGTTGQKGKRKRTTTATTASSYTSAASGAEEEQQQIQQPQVASTSSSTGAVVVAGAQRLGEAEQRRKQQALDYTSRHAGTLGIGDGQQVYKFMKGAYRPIKNSSLQAVLAYHLHLPNNHNNTIGSSPRPATKRSSLTLNSIHSCHTCYSPLPALAASAEKDMVVVVVVVVVMVVVVVVVVVDVGAYRPNAKAVMPLLLLLPLQGKQEGRKFAEAALLPRCCCTHLKRRRLERSGSVVLFCSSPNFDSNNSNNKNAEVQAQKRELLIEKVLDELYKDTRSNAAFTSVEPLLLEARRQHPGRGISRAEVRRYLARQRVYTLHRRAVRRFRRLPTLASGLHTDWQADLADFTALKRQNRGHAYLLVCADTLSRQLFVEPLTKSSPPPQCNAFWPTKRCNTIACTPHPSGMPELRSVPSEASRLYRYFTHRGAKCWTGVIQHIVTALNGSPNRALFGLRPNEINFGNAERVRRNQLERLDVGQQQRQSPRARLPFRVGDRVRIEKHKHVFKKGYLPRFTDELFTVAEVRTSRLPITYKLRDDDGKLLTGWFYAQDLCLVLKPPPPLRSKRDEPIADKAGAADSATVGPVYDIERVLRRRRGRDGAEHCFVKWKGYSAAHNSWIPATSII